MAVKQGVKLNRLSFKQHVHIGDRLREVCKLQDNGYALYDEGFNDVVLAKEFDPEWGVQAHHIANIRKQLVGAVLPPVKERKGFTKADDKHIKALENKVWDLDYFMRAVAHHIGATPQEIMEAYAAHERSQKFPRLVQQ